MQRRVSLSWPRWTSFWRTDSIFFCFFFGLFFGLKGTAGAGSLILEFSLLSRLTGDDRYEVCSVNVLSSWDDRGAKC